MSELRMRACTPRDSRSGNRTHVTNLALTIHASGPWKLQVPCILHTVIVEDEVVLSRPIVKDEVVLSRPVHLKKLKNKDGSNNEVW
jgi:hypothetical protein